MSSIRFPLKEWKILIFCNKDGLFSVNVHKGSDTAREF